MTPRASQDSVSTDSGSCWCDVYFTSGVGFGTGRQLTLAAFLYVVVQCSGGRWVLQQYGRAFRLLARLASAPWPSKPNTRRGGFGTR